MAHSKNFDYTLKLLHGVDAHGAPCYSYTLFPPAHNTASEDPEDGGMVIYSGWGRPSTYDTQAALDILRKEYLR